MPDLGELKELRDKMLVAVSTANSRLAVAHYRGDTDAVKGFRERSNAINNELGRLLEQIAELEPPDDNADPEPASV